MGTNPRASGHESARRGARPELKLGSKAIVERAICFLDARGAAPLRLPELCEAVGCSERTLRAAFLKFYGVGPHRYLCVRRLHLIRAALLMADPVHETVARVLQRLGISDGGRMARDYLQLFGEYPSVTLGRHVSANAPGSRPRRSRESVANH